jgi:hypothetical protein
MPKKTHSSIFPSLFNSEKITPLNTDSTQQMTPSRFPSIFSVPVYSTNNYINASTLEHAELTAKYINLHFKEIWKNRCKYIIEKHIKGIDKIEAILRQFMDIKVTSNIEDIAQGTEYIAIPFVGMKTKVLEAPREIFDIIEISKPGMILLDSTERPFKRGESDLDINATKEYSKKHIKLKGYRHFDDRFFVLYIYGNILNLITKKVDTKLVESFKKNHIFYTDGFDSFIQAILKENTIRDINFIIIKLNTEHFYIGNHGDLSKIPWENIRDEIIEKYPDENESKLESPIEEKKTKVIKFPSLPSRATKKPSKLVPIDTGTIDTGTISLEELSQKGVEESSQKGVEEPLPDSLQKLLDRTLKRSRL